MKADGSRSGTWDGSTRTTTCIWATGCEDMILTGGANVYPAEVEAAIQEHPDVRSVAVIGLPDDDLGNIVHAVDRGGSGRRLRGRICSPSSPNGVARYKVPRSIEYTDQPLRNEAGKLRRGALRAERTGRRHGLNAVFHAVSGAANAATTPTTASNSVPL